MLLAGPCQTPDPASRAWGPGVSATGKAAGGPAAWADVAAVDHGAVVVLEKLQPAGARALDLVDGALRPSGVDQLGLVTPRGSKLSSPLEGRSTYEQLSLRG